MFVYCITSHYLQDVAHVHDTIGRPKKAQTAATRYNNAIVTNPIRSRLKDRQNAA